MAKLNELPFAVESPEAKKPAMPMMGQREEAAEGGKIPGYVEPWERCANCEYFDGENTCKKFKAPADMDGSCPSFEEPDAGGEEEEESEGYGREGEEEEEDA